MTPPTPVAPPLPTTRDEAWRYTPADVLAARFETARPAPRPAPVLVDRATVDRLAGRLDGPRLVFVNGFYDAGLSDAVVAPGMWAGVLDGPRNRHAARLVRTGRAEDGFAAHNHAAAGPAAVILADAGTDAAAPVHVVYVTVSGDQPVVCHPRTVLVAGRDTRVEVVESYVAAGDGSGGAGGVFTNAATRVIAGPGAVVGYDRVLQDTPSATHVGHVRVLQAPTSTVRATSVVHGADIARVTFDVVVDGDDAHVAISGLSVPSGSQHHDQTVVVDHAASHGVSRQHFRAVVDGHAHAAFSGHVIVEAGTVGVDADQTARSLLLAPTAHADARPWLEIYADDVACTHGAAVGRLDDDALFYLRSRGIPSAVARRMLVAAFARDVVETIPHLVLRDHLAAVIGLTQP